MRLAVAVLVFSVGLAIESTAQGPLFVTSAGMPIAVGRGSGEVVLADLNRDGHLDLLTKHLLGQAIAVRAGNGKGEFALLPGGPMTFAYQPGAIALGDVNNDRVLDLGIASRERDREYVHILLGNGRGSFSESSGSPVAASAAFEFYKPALFFADVNEDGRADVVASNGRRNSIEILLGDGRGAFAWGSSVALEPGRDLYSVALGDVDADGHVDLVTAGSVESGQGEGRLQIMRGNGKGVFVVAPGSTLSIPAQPRVAALADLNGDGRSDIVISYGRGSLGILLNDGNGTIVPGLAASYSVDGPANRVVVADVNRDGRSDLVAATVDSVTVMLGGESGLTPASGSPFPAGPGAYHVAAGDLNEDGRADLVASSFEGETAALLLGR